MSTNLRKKSYDLTKPEYFKPQTRLEANKWLDKAQFGAATARTDVSASTKANIVPLAGEVDDAVKLMDIGYEAYLDAQLADTSIIRPFTYFVDGGTGLYTFPAGDTFGQFSSGGPIAGYQHYGPWFYSSCAHSSSPIRMKTLFALTQIFAMRQTGGNRAPGIARVLEAMFDATLSTESNTKNYRWLLKQITMSDQMGMWLTYKGNMKRLGNRQPDENYFRELLQLFTMGLICRNMDGTPLLDENGVPVPTYKPEDIPKGAGSMTGLQIGDTAELNRTGHMLKFDSMAFGSDFDPELGTIELFAYPGGSPVVIPARPRGTSFDNTRFDQPTNYTVQNATANSFQVTLPLPCNGAETNRTLWYSLSSDFSSPVQCTITSTLGSAIVTVNKTAHGLTNGTVIYNKHPVEIAIDALLDHAFNHPTTPPFLAMSLIKFFVTSNPTPQYIRRVAEVFVDDGNGVRGNIPAVVKAILLDREAIVPLGINPRTHGKVLNPFEKVMKTFNALRSDVVHINTEGDIAKNPWHTDRQMFTKPRRIGDWNAAMGMVGFNGQMMFMNTPSVFNFYRPGYVPPSTAFGELGLTAPEMQIHNAEAETVWVNMVEAAIDYKDQQTTFPLRDTGYQTLDNTHEGMLDLRGGSASLIGMDTKISEWTVTAKGAGSLTFNFTPEFVTTSGDARFNFYARNRRTGEILNNYYVVVSSGSGTKSVTVTSLPQGHVDNTNIGDVYDCRDCATLPHSGFPTRKYFDGGGVPRPRTYQHAVTMLYKMANTLPNDSANPTQGQIDTAINYLESILMSKPISSELRALMSQAAVLPVTLPARRIAGVTDATSLNSFAYYYHTYNQVRIRRMLGLLLLSPEYGIQY